MLGIILKLANAKVATTGIISLLFKPNFKLKEIKKNNKYYNQQSHIDILDKIVLIQTLVH